MPSSFYRLTTHNSVARRGGSSLDIKNGRTNFFAPFLDLLPDLVANLAHLIEHFFFRACDRRRIGKTPMQPFCRAREDGTFLGAGFVANGNDVGEELAGLEDIEDGARLFMRDIVPISFMTSTAKGLSVPGSRPALWASKKSPQM